MIDPHDYSSPEDYALAVARDLVAMGVPIFRAPGMQLPTRWQNTPPSDSTAEIDAWQPGDGLAAVMGHTFDAIDIDPRNGGQENVLDAFTTYGRQRTPRGGVHGLIAPLGVGKHQSVLPGVDLQGGRPDGTGRGFIWIAPTVRHGKAYSWVTSMHPLHPGPPGDDSGEWFKSLILKPAAAAVERRVHGKELAEPDADPPPPTYIARFFSEDVPAYIVAEPGTGDTRLFQLVARAREMANAGWVELDEALDAINTARAHRIREHPSGGGQTEEDFQRILGSSKRAVGSKKAVRSELKVGGKAVGSYAPKASAAGTDTDAGPMPVEESTGKVRLIPASSITPRRVRWLRHDRIPLGEITLVAGREGTGKSTYLAHLAAQVTRGTALGEFEEPRGVLYVANEDSWGHTVVPRLMAAGADMDRVFNVESTEDRGLVLPMDVDALVDAAKEVNAGAIMLDPIISLIDDKLSTDRARELRQALEPLRRAAEAADVALVALVHFNKNDGDVLTKIAGSRGWVEVARAVIGIAVDEDEGHVVMSQVKNNLGRLDLSHWAYKIESHAIDTPEGRAWTGRLEWISKVENGVASLMDAKRGRPKKADEHSLAAWVTSEATVRDALVPAKEIETRFEKVADWSRATVHRRLKQAVESGLLTRHHGGYGVAGGYPAETETPETVS